MKVEDFRAKHGDRWGISLQPSADGWTCRIYPAQFTSHVARARRTTTFKAASDYAAILQADLFASSHDPETVTRGVGRAA